MFEGLLDLLILNRFCYLTCHYSSTSDYVCALIQGKSHVQTDYYCFHIFHSLQTTQLQQTSTHIADPAVDCPLLPHHANTKTPIHQPKQLCLRHNRKNTDPKFTTKTSVTMPSQTSSSGSSGSFSQGYSVTGSGTNSQVCCAFVSRALDPHGKNGSCLPILPRHLCNTATPKLLLTSPLAG